MGVKEVILDVFVFGGIAGLEGSVADGGLDLVEPSSLVRVTRDSEGSTTELFSNKIVRTLLRSVLTLGQGVRESFRAEVVTETITVLNVGKISSRSQLSFHFGRFVGVFSSLLFAIDWMIY